VKIGLRDFPLIGIVGFCLFLFLVESNVASSTGGLWMTRLLLIDNGICSGVNYLT
jgi:hypothetical protein